MLYPNHGKQRHQQNHGNHGNERRLTLEELIGSLLTNEMRLRRLDDTKEGTTNKLANACFMAKENKEKYMQEQRRISSLWIVDA